jgi:EpsI family protein
MKRWPVVVAVVMLVGAWGSLQTLSHGEPVLAKKPFAEFPLTLGERWQGKELGLEPKTLEVLKLTDYMLRVYAPLREERETGNAERGTMNDGRADRRNTPAPVYLYVGYYQSQRTGSTYHSPKNCLPGAGWQFVETEYLTVPVQGTAPITINHVVIQKGLDKQVIFYWYQDRGRVIASEYWAKAYMIWDAMTKTRTDGALVRVSVPVTTTTEEAAQQGLAFVRDVWPRLLDFMPESDQG